MKTKLCSQLDTNGYFVGTTIADESPLEPGVFLLPGGAVDAPAPVMSEGKRAKWIGTSFVIENIPEPPQPIPPTVEEIKQQQRRDIDAQRDAALTAGCLHKGKLYPFDDVMIAAVTGRIVRWREGRIPVDAKLPVRLKDNSIELLSRDEHLDLADALSDHGESIYATSWAAKDAL